MQTDSFDVVCDHLGKIERVVVRTQPSKGMMGKMGGPGGMMGGPGGMMGGSGMGAGPTSQPKPPPADDDELPGHEEL